MDFSQTGKWLIVLGIGIVVIGIVMAVSGKFGFGKLPGDFTFHIGDSTIFVPLASFTIISLVLTAIANLIIRLFK
ncbi:MAG: DUF2905 domain-containing protein [Dehalogenimonas sp.]